MKLLEISDEQRKEIQREEVLILSELDRICGEHQIKYTVAYGTLIGAIRHDGFIPWDDDVDVCMPRPDFELFKEICKSELKADFFYQDNHSDPEYFYLIDKIRLNGTIFRESFVAKYNIHHGIYIDIFPVDNIPDNRFQEAVQYYKFHFFRTGLMAKYLDLEARKGKKKLLMAVLQKLYFPFSIRFLYGKAMKTAAKYQDRNCNKAGCFFSPYRKKDVFSADMFRRLQRHSFEDIEVNIPEMYDQYLSSIYGKYMELPSPSERITKHTVTELSLLQSETT